jgi:hypothetical protein
VKLQNLYSSQNKIKMTKSWEMRWAGHVAYMEEKRNAYKVFVESQKEGEH